MTRHATRFSLTLLLITASANLASAQGALGAVHPLFVTAIREPISTDTAPTARSLAMGGMRGTSGLADEALSSPANLLRGNGTDIVVSGGAFSFSRAESVTTSGFLGGAEGVFTPAHVRPIGFAAVATRRRRWAIGGFIDATSGYTHRFDTSSSLVDQFQNRGGFLDTNATGSATVSGSVTKMGGALAFAPLTGRVSMGVSAYAARFNYSATARLDETLTGNYVPGGAVNAIETEEVTFDSTRLGWVASADVRISATWRASVRWQDDPRNFSVRSNYRESPPAARAALASGPQSQNVAIQLPASLDISTDASVGHTNVGLAASRVFSGNYFQQQDYTCLSFGTNCPGWGWNEQLMDGSEPPRQAYQLHTADIWLIRAGVEQRVDLGHGNLRLRGGISLAQDASLTAYSPTFSDPRARSEDFTGFIERPERAETVTWSTGVGYAWDRIEIAGAVATGNNRTRVMLDFRMALQ